MPPKPDFLAIGHVSLDLTERGPVPGGAAFYASITAARLEWRAGLLTRGAGPEVEECLRSLDLVVNAPSEVTTTFEMRYSGDARTQTLHAVAPPIEEERLPAGWGEVRWRCWRRCFTTCRLRWRTVPPVASGRRAPGMAAANVVEGLSEARRLVRRAGPKSGRRGDSFGVGRCRWAHTRPLVDPQRHIHPDQGQKRRRHAIRG